MPSSGVTPFERSEVGSRIFGIPHVFDRGEFDCLVARRRLLSSLRLLTMAT